MLATMQHREGGPMARKGQREAEGVTERAHLTRLQYLSRNPDFRKSLDSLTNLRSALPEPGTSELTNERLDVLLGFTVRADQIAREWGIPFDLLSALAWKKWLEGVEPQERIPAASPLMDPPVVAWMDGVPAFMASVFGMDSTERQPEDNRYLNLRVDLDHPVEALLPLIEKELGRFSREHRQGRRRRLDTVAFHLGVFDRAEAGETFKAIASNLGKRSSTVKSAFLVARRNIYGSIPGPSKGKLPLRDFDPEKHSRDCAVCKTAQTFETMCAKVRKYALQDHKSQRELTGFDPVRDTRSPDC